MQVETAERKILPNGNGSIRPVKEEVLYLSKSLQLSQYTFEDENGKAKSAEVIRKRYMVGVNKFEQTIISIAILRRQIVCDCLILVRRYRPTLKSYTLEFPARIVEQTPGTSAASAAGSIDQTGDLAAKEIEENTGYGSTTIWYISPETATDPELCDSKVKLVSMIIDGDDPIKNHPTTTGSNNGTVPRKYSRASHYSASSNSDDEQPEEEEEFELVLVPINGLLDRLSEYCRNGTIVDSRVYLFSIGLKKGEKLNQNESKQENLEVAI